MIAYVDGSPVLNKVAVYTQGVYYVYGIYDEEFPVTNNEAKYIAVYYALLLRPFITEIVSDSLLIVNQLSGCWNVNKPGLCLLYNKVKCLERRHYASSMVYTWVPRGTNPAGLHLDKLLKHRKVWL